MVKADTARAVHGISLNGRDHSSEPVHFAGYIDKPVEKND